MKAHVGDRVVIKGHSIGTHQRTGRVLEVRGSQGEAPYVVEWDDAEGEHLFFPGSDAEILTRPASEQGL
jgi:hypothetical protein